jgi:hypothetical protein
MRESGGDDGKVVKGFEAKLGEAGRGGASRDDEEMDLVTGRTSSEV